LTELNADSVKRGFAPSLTPRVLAQHRSCHFRLNPNWQDREFSFEIAQKEGPADRSTGPLSFLSS